MSKIASLWVREEIKNILDSGGFFRDVQSQDALGPTCFPDFKIKKIVN